MLYRYNKCCPSLNKIQHLDEKANTQRLCFVKNKENISLLLGITASNEENTQSNL